MNIAFILETALIILVVFLVGAILGYLIRCWFFKPQVAMTPSSTSAKPAAPSSPIADRSKATPPPAKTPPPAQPSAPPPAALAPNDTEDTESEASLITKPATQAEPKAAEMVADEAGKDDSSAKPVGLSEPRNGQKDDLKRIKGIGPKIEATLNELGIFHFDQIAEWSPASIDWVNGFLSFKGRVQRENWLEQSKALASGGETEFSKRVDKGAVPSSKK